MITRLFTTMTFLAAAATAGRFDMQARNDFFAGFSGNKEALERGLKSAEEALAQDPRNAEALVWHGGGLFFQAGQIFQTGGDRTRGIELYTRGLKEMDDAVALAPTAIGVLIPRGSVLIAATRAMPPSPQSAALLRKGLGDYEKAYAIQQDHFDQLGSHPRGELMFGLAEGYLRANDPERARSWFQKLAGDKEAGHSAQAREYLAQGKFSGGSNCVGCHIGK